MLCALLDKPISKKIFCKMSAHIQCSISLKNTRIILFKVMFCGLGLGLVLRLRIEHKEFS